MVDGLKELGHYRFRVRAINAAGVSQPGEVPEVIELKDRISKLLNDVLMIMSASGGSFKNIIS